MTSYDEKTDEDLMALVCSGDHRAFSVLVKRHTQKFFNLAYRTLGNEKDAEDIVQDSFTKVWRKPTLYKPERGAKFTTWFYRIVVNASIDLKRKNKPVYGLEEQMVDGDYIRQDEKMVVAEEYAQLESAIQQLPERQQTALNLCYYQGVAQKEAADIMGVGVKALESLLSRAKASLKEQYSNMKDEEKQVSYAAR